MSDAKLKYLPVPRNSVVVLYDLGNELTDGISEQEAMYNLVEQLIIASNHNDFLVVEMNNGADMEIVAEEQILDWLESKRGNRNI